MSEPTLLLAGAHGMEVDLLGALLRGAITAAVVAALLLAAHRWGRDLSGLLAGLPTVTGPALVWLALDQGIDFAAQAAHGAVAAAVPCALFALTYASRAGRDGRWPSLGWASVACAASLLPLSQWNGPLPVALVVAVLTCGICLALMPKARPVVPPAVAPAPRAPALRAGALTALVSAGVSALACLLAQAIGPLWAGVLSSPPLLAAAVVLELHRQGCPLRVADFLRGYTAGLVSRSVFVAVFGTLLLAQGLGPAVAAAVVVALLLGGGTLALMRWRVRLARLRGAMP